VTRKQHGVLSLAIMLLAIVIAIIFISRQSLSLAAIYLVASIISMAVIIYSFCSKCPCRKHECGHVLLGWLTRFFPDRKEEKYTVLDLSGVLIPLLFIIVFPQFWIKSSIPVLVAFWGLLILTGLEISTRVCRGCGNKYCPLNSK